MQILLVEDDVILGDGIRQGLSQYGYAVTWVKDGKSALSTVKLQPYDLAVLDINIPIINGLKVLESIRQQKIELPVMLLTAYDAVEDRVKGLDAGADDYLTKPFDLDELCARIRALIRRFNGRSENTITYGDISIDPSAHLVFKNGELVNISRREFDLLQKLIENQGRVMTRDQLTQALYGWDDDIDSNALEVHIHNLRKKFSSELIRTVRGVGYIVNKIGDEKA